MSLSTLLYQINVNTLLLVSFFIFVFAMLMFILRKTAFGKNNTIATVISLVIAFMAMYGINTLDWNLTGFFYGIGLSDQILYTITPILVLLFVFFLSRKKDPTTNKKKFSFSRFLIILGATMLALGLTPVIYQKAFMIGVGAGLIAIGLFLNIKKKKEYNGSVKGVKFPLPGLLMLLGLVLVGLAFLEIVYNTGIFFVAGGILFLIGLKILFSRRKAKKFANMSLEEIKIYKESEARNAQKWNQSGRNIGKGIATTGYGVGQAGKYTKDQARKINKEIKKRRRAARIARIREKRLAEEQAEQNRKSESIGWYEFSKKQNREQVKKQQLALPPAKQQLALPPHEQKQFIKNEKLRQKTIQNLKSLYNQKYQEAIKQANFTAKGIAGAREKYLRLQKEMQRIVDKLNKI